MRADPIRDPARSAAARGHAAPRRMLPVRWQFARRVTIACSARCRGLGGLARVLGSLSMSQDFPSARVPNSLRTCPQAWLAGLRGRNRPDLQIRGRCSELFRRGGRRASADGCRAAHARPPAAMPTTPRIAASAQALLAVLCLSNLRAPRGYLGSSVPSVMTWPALRPGRNHIFAKAKNPLSVDARHADDAVARCGCSPRVPFRSISEDGGHRLPCKPEIREGTIIPDGRRRELFSGADRIVRVRRIGRNRPGGLRGFQDSGTARHNAASPGLPTTWK